MDNRDHSELVNKILKSTGLQMDDELDGQTVVGIGKGTLEIKSGDTTLILKHNERITPVSQAPVLIGRDPDCTISINSMMVSRFHAIIYRFGKQFVIRDLHSTNGLTLNDESKTYAPIRSGDRIGIGDDLLEVGNGWESVLPYFNPCTVLFMNVPDYKNLCEKHGAGFARQIQSMLDHLKDKMLLNAGCPIKNLGAGLMGAFGLWPGEKGSPHPCDSALFFVEQAQQHLRQQFSRLPAVQLRFGLAFGEVSVQDKDELDLFGDSVNLASRLEMSNATYGTEVMMNAGFMRHLQNAGGVREIDTVRVQGKQEPVTIYTFQAAASEASQLYSQGLALYKQGKFKAALNCFAQGATLKDSPSLCMKKRLNAIFTIRTEKWRQNWDRVWNLDKA